MFVIMPQMHLDTNHLNFIESYSYVVRGRSVFDVFATPIFWASIVVGLSMPSSICMWLIRPVYLEVLDNKCPQQNKPKHVPGTKYDTRYQVPGILLLRTAVVPGTYYSYYSTYHNIQGSSR